MSVLRDAAAMWVEHGRALGMLEEARQSMVILREALAREPHPSLQASLDVLRDERIPQLVLLVKRSQEQAQDLMQQVEHPGAALARRLVTTARAARVAWRASR